MEKFENKNVQESTQNECCNNKPKDWSYKTGELVGIVLVACATAVVVALTTKFIFWLF